MFGRDKSRRRPNRRGTIILDMGKDHDTGFNRAVRRNPQTGADADIARAMAIVDKRRIEPAPRAPAAAGRRASEVDEIKPGDFLWIRDEGVAQAYTVTEEDAVTFIKDDCLQSVPTGDAIPVKNIHDDDFEALLSELTPGARRVARRARSLAPQSLSSMEQAGQFGKAKRAFEKRLVLDTPTTETEAFAFTERLFEVK
jgi:hypothetical protein